MVVHLDLRSLLPAARNQGPRGTCLAFATSDGHLLARKQLDLLSTEYLFFHAAQLCGSNGTDGITLSAASNALRSAGQPAETAWPYAFTLPNPWNPPKILTSLWTRSSSISMLPSLADVRATFSKGNPLVLCLKITKSFRKPDSQEWLISDASSPTIGSHAVLLVGVGVSQAGESSFLIRNSWGDSWADAGHAWITETYLKKTLFGVLEIV